MAEDGEPMNLHINNENYQELKDVAKNNLFSKRGKPTVSRKRETNT
jgi:hypothetical protein